MTTRGLVVELTPEQRLTRLRSTFAHLYDGWIDTDSRIMDARGPQRCFAALDAPEPGCSWAR